MSAKAYSWKFEVSAARAGTNHAQGAAPPTSSAYRTRRATSHARAGPVAVPRPLDETTRKRVSAEAASSTTTFVPAVAATVSHAASSAPVCRST